MDLTQTSEIYTKEINGFIFTVNKINSKTQYITIRDTNYTLRFECTNTSLCSNFIDTFKQFTNDCCDFLKQENNL